MTVANREGIRLQDLLRATLLSMSRSVAELEKTNMRVDLNEAPLEIRVDGRISKVVRNGEDIYITTTK